jgi:hypothetical protein
MKKTNILVRYHPDSDPENPIDLTPNIAGLFKLYPDQTSHTWLQSQAAGIAGRSSHGPWLTILAINLPEASTGLLPVGTGIIKISTIGGDVTYPRFTPEVDAIDIALEILPGSGSPNPLQYADFIGNPIDGDLSMLEPMPQVVVKPPIPAEGEQIIAPYGAIEIKVHAEIRKIGGSADGSDVDPTGIRVIADDQPDHAQTQMQTLWSKNGDEVTIMLVSPLGLHAHEARASIVPLLYNGFLNQVTGTPSLISIDYYDLDGLPAIGPIPTVEIQ